MLSGKVLIPFGRVCVCVSQAYLGCCTKDGITTRVDIVLMSDSRKVSYNILH
jgi:hypothetical protein